VDAIGGGLFSCIFTITAGLADADPKIVFKYQQRLFYSRRDGQAELAGVD